MSLDNDPTANCSLILAEKEGKYKMTELLLMIAYLLPEQYDKVATAGIL